jgi:outer membrane receptor protein involved in Fe transport
VRLDVQPGLRATGDASALERAFTDIFFHARQLGGGEQVFVQARQADAFVEVVVSHGAARIPAELRSELFVVGGARQLRDRKIPVLASGLFYARSAVVGQGGGMEFRDAADGSLELVIRLVRDA